MSLLYGLSGHDEPAQHRHGARRAGARSAAGARGDSRGGGHGLQDCRGAVPHVGARRVRRRADAHHGVSVGRIEGGVVRDAAADLRGEPAGDARDRGAGQLARAGHRLEHDVLRAGGGHDDGGEFRRADAEQSQADAGVLVDRARRVPADRRRGGHHARRDRDADLSVRVRVHAAGRVRASSRCCGAPMSSATS